MGIFITANWALANDLAPAGEAGKFLGLTNLATAGAGAISRLTGPGIDWLNASRPGQNLGYAALFVGGAVLSLVSLIWPAGRARSDGRAGIRPGRLLCSLTGPRSHDATFDRMHPQLLGRPPPEWSTPSRPPSPPCPASTFSTGTATPTTTARSSPSPAPRRRVGRGRLRRHRQGRRADRPRPAPRRAPAHRRHRCRSLRPAGRGHDGRLRRAGAARWASAWPRSWASRSTCMRPPPPGPTG